MLPLLLSLNATGNQGSWDCQLETEDWVKERDTINWNVAIIVVGVSKITVKGAKRSWQNHPRDRDWMHDFHNSIDIGDHSMSGFERTIVINNKNKILWQRIEQWPSWY